MVDRGSCSRIFCLQDSQLVVQYPQTRSGSRLFVFDENLVKTLDRTGVHRVYLSKLGGVYPSGEEFDIGGVGMSAPINKKTTLRDYSKPIIPVFRGKKGYRAYVEIATTPPTRYNAEAEKKKAADNLRKQGLEV